MVLVPADVTDFFIVPQDRNIVLLEATIEPYEEPDEYIDPSVEEKLPEEAGLSGDSAMHASVEELLRSRMKGGADFPLN